MSKKTITVDLESYAQPCVLGNVTGGIHPDQMMVYSAGRQTGKSMINKAWAKMQLNSAYGKFGTNLCNEIMLPISFDKSKPKYKFSRAKWHIAYLAVFSDEFDDCLAWCTEHFGPRAKHSDAWSRWIVGFGEIYFRDEQDYMLYQLRWA